MIIDATKASRDTLKSHFVSNAIPTAAQFAQLIDSLLNQREDRLVKTPDAPLSIEGVGPDTGLRKVLDFYEELGDATPSWSLSLRARPNDNRRVLAIGDGAGAGNARLAIEATSGNVGLGTAEPKQRLDVAGDIGLGGRLALSSPDNWLRLNQAGAFDAGTTTPGLFASRSLNVGGLNNWGNPGANNAVVAGSLGIGVFAPTERVQIDGRLRAGALTLGPWPGNPANYVFLGSSLLDQSNEGNYGIRFGTGAEPGATLVNSNTYIGLRIRNDQHVVLSGNGRLGVGTNAPRARLEVANGAIMPAAGDGEAAGILFPPDAFGGGGDRAWIRWLSRSGENTTLEIGVANDPADHIALMASGGVGIGTREPSVKLHVVGDTIITGQLSVHKQQDWVNATLQNGWVRYDNGYAPAGYMKDSLGFVHLRGLVRSGTMHSAIFTLPDGFRPHFRHLSCRSSAGNGQGRVDISADGQVLPVGGDAGWMSLDGIVFHAAPFNVVFGGGNIGVIIGGGGVVFGGGQQ